MGSTGSGFLGLARGMAEYLTYLRYLPTQDRKTIVKIIGDVLLPTRQLNILQFSKKKYQYLFEHLGTYLTYLIESSKTLKKDLPLSG